MDTTITEEVAGEPAASDWSGTCTGCEKHAGFLVPWAGESLCLDCTDYQLDLLALALAELPVTVGRGGTTPGHVATMEVDLDVCHH